MYQWGIEVAYLHGPSLLHEAGLHLVLQIVNLLWEVELGSPRLDPIPLAERHPPPAELGGLRQRVEQQHGRAIVRDVAADLLHRIINGQDGEDGVGGDDGRLLERVDGADEDVDRGEAVGLAFGFEPEGEEVEVGLAVDGEPLGELVEDPGEGEPDLADNGEEPEGVGVVGGSGDAEAEEEEEGDEPEDDDYTVGVDLARWDGDFPP